MVALTDGLKIEVPSWMLDASVCTQLRAELLSRVSLSALRDLRALLDAQPPSMSQAPVHLPSPAEKEAKCARLKKGRATR
jgi:hypothetical protein